MAPCIDEVKPDRMIVRFVKRSLGKAASGLTADRLAFLIHEAALVLGVNVPGLDHAIWRHESGRVVCCEQTA